ncbi:eukaryotic translation initiation factor 3 subunit G-domain-containing protein [Mycena leptocephala]|nr:eukaryotic translation initiation factor 3 subunit G-domain-containing protein [Mycena leptocephala]
MPVATSDVAKASWADELDEAETRKNEDFVDENGIRTMIEYTMNDDGKKVKITRRSKRTLQKSIVDHTVAERLKWAKFGKEKGKAAGPDRVTTTIGENIALKITAGNKGRWGKGRWQGGRIQNTSGFTYVLEELVDTGPHVIPAPAVNDPPVASCSSNAAESGAVLGRRAASDLCLRRTNQYLRSPSMIATTLPTTPAITRVLLCFTLEDYFNTWAELSRVRDLRLSFVGSRLGRRGGSGGFTYRARTTGARSDTCTRRARDVCCGVGGKERDSGGGRGGHGQGDCPRGLQAKGGDDSTAMHSLVRQDSALNWKSAFVHVQRRGEGDGKKADEARTWLGIQSHQQHR